MVTDVQITTKCCIESTINTDCNRICVTVIFKTVCAHAACDLTQSHLIFTLKTDVRFVFQGVRGDAGLLISSGPSWPWSSTGTLNKTTVWWWPRCLTSVNSTWSAKSDADMKWNCVETLLTSLNFNRLVKAKGQILKIGCESDEE